MSAPGPRLEQYLIWNKTFAQLFQTMHLPNVPGPWIYEVLIKSLRPSVLVRLQGSVHSLALSHH